MCRQGLNFSCYKSEAADLLLEKGASVLNAQERKIYYDELQEQLMQDRPGLFLYVSDNLLLVAPRIGGVGPSSYGIMQDMGSWYVNKDEHKYNTEPSE